MESRIKIVKGLIQKKAKSALQDLIQSLKETKEFISVLAKTAWNGFFENIWKKRCELVSNWEKSVEITPKEKKKKEEASSRTKPNNEVTQKNKEGIVIDQVNRTKEIRKEEDNRGIQKLWQGSVYEWISNRMRLFFWGLNG